MYAKEVARMYTKDYAIQYATKQQGFNQECIKKVRNDLAWINTEVPENL